MKHMNNIKEEELDAIDFNTGYFQALATCPDGSGFDDFITDELYCSDSSGSLVEALESLAAFIDFQRHSAA